jgi:CBS domain-containing protein
MRGAAADVLTPTGAVISANAPLEDAEQRIIVLGVSELYVLSADGRLAGILPDHELLKRRLSGDRRRLCVSDLMSPIGVSVHCATPLAEIAMQMRCGNLRRIPVVANGRLVGEVTRCSLLRYCRVAASNSERASVEASATAAAETLPAGPTFLRRARLGDRAAVAHNLQIPPSAG